MHLVSIISRRNFDFVALCKEHKVNKMYAFGSSITDHFDPSKSDVDVVVELDIQDPLDYGETLLTFWDKLEIFFNRKVDLLTDESIHNPYLRRTIDSTRKLIYDRQGEKVFV
jgi:predicted nucleotidyltransferase